MSVALLNYTSDEWVLYYSKSSALHYILPDSGIVNFPGRMFFLVKILKSEYLCQQGNDEKIRNLYFILKKVKLLAANNSCMSEKVTYISSYSVT